jgi:archaellum biogenesis protein FlaJ (TadC family)
MPRNETSDYKQIYQKSGLKLEYKTYITKMYATSVAAFIVTFIVGWTLHQFLFVQPLFQSIFAVTILAFISVLLVAVAFIINPIMRSKQRKNEIETNLVYTTGYMSVLSAGGISIERVFNRVAEVESKPAIKELANRFVANIKMFGLDVNASIDDVKRRSPSEVFAKLLVGVVNTIKTSGDLKNLLIFETNRLLSLKREQLKKTTAAMTALSEIYVTVMVMAPITFIIMLTILSVLGTAQFGLSPAMQLNLLVFFGLPLLCVMFIVLLDGILPKEE